MGRKCQCVIEFQAQRLKEIVEVLRADGVNIHQSNPLIAEFRDDNFCDDTFCWFNRPHIYFDGDDDECQRVMEIGKQHGFPITSLVRFQRARWVGGPLMDSYWMMGFTLPLPRHPESTYNPCKYATCVHRQH